MKKKKFTKKDFAKHARMTERYESLVDRAESLFETQKSDRESFLTASCASSVMVFGLPFALLAIALKSPEVGADSTKTIWLIYIASAIILVAVVVFLIKFLKIRKKIKMLRNRKNYYLKIQKEYLNKNKAMIASYKRYLKEKEKKRIKAEKLKAKRQKEKDMAKAKKLGISYKQYMMKHCRRRNNPYRDDDDYGIGQLGRDMPYTAAVGIGIGLFD